MLRQKSLKNLHVLKYVPVFSTIFASPDTLSLRCAEVFYKMEELCPFWRIARFEFVMKRNSAQL